VCYVDEGANPNADGMHTNRGQNMTEGQCN